jgi:hypothetical protein
MWRAELYWWLEYFDPVFRCRRSQTALDTSAAPTPAIIAFLISPGSYLIARNRR